jgi:hypothetical protein
MPNERYLDSLPQLEAMAKEHLVIAGFIAEHTQLSYKQIAAELARTNYNFRGIDGKPLWT